MLWGIRVAAVLVLGGMLWMLFKPQHQPQSTAAQSQPMSAPTVSSLNATAPVRVTVYQDSSNGVSSFSDRIDRGQPHVIDHSKGNTYQSTYRGEVPNTASVTYTPAVAASDPIDRLREEKALSQQQVQQGKEQRIQAAISE